MLSNFQGPGDDWVIPEPNSRTTRLVDMRSIYGYTALHYAVYADKMDAVKVCVLCVQCRVRMHAPACMHGMICVRACVYVCARLA